MRHKPKAIQVWRENPVGNHDGPNGQPLGYRVYVCALCPLEIEFRPQGWVHWRTRR